MSEQINEIKRVYSGLETLYSTYFPKSDSSFIDDLLRRSLKDPEMPPIYMVEVFTRTSVNPEVAKQYIFEKTGMIPGVRKWNSFRCKSQANARDSEGNIGF